MRVIVVGAGIAGLTAALCFRARGHEVLVFERSPGLRGGGYMLDFFGPGFDAAERLGLLPALARIHYNVKELAFLGEGGQPKFALPYTLVRKRLFGDRHFNFMRGDLERVLYDDVARKAPIRYGAELQSIEQDAFEVRARFGDGSTISGDLLVGADGARSATRALVFGNGGRFIRYLGFHTAAFLVDDPEVARSFDDAFATLTVPGRQLAVYPVRDGRIATFWVHPAKDPLRDTSLDAARTELRRVYGALGWIAPRLLASADRAQSLYFDDVSQVELPHWSAGRVALVGDACGCVSLLAGQGASLALAGAYVLAESVADESNLAEGIAHYERRLAPSVAKKQKAARGLARWFVPDGDVRLALRDAVVRRSASSIGGWLLRRQIAGESVLS
jgi:2-polyprenyl-6-methoxyphenol hydroxylase-like FAD-dependent oxidoreductase